MLNVGYIYIKWAGFAEVFLFVPPFIVSFRKGDHLRLMPVELVQVLHS